MDRHAEADLMRGNQGPSGDLSSPAALPKARYEPLDAPPLLPLWLGLLIAAFIGLVLLSVSLGFPLAVHSETRGPLRPLPPAPRLQSAPERDLQQYRAAKARELRPIDAAMRATATQGWGPPK